MLAGAARVVMGAVGARVVVVRVAVEEAGVVGVVGAMVVAGE